MLSSWIKGVKNNHFLMINYRNYCQFCHLPRLCIGNEINIKKNWIEVKKINPCIDCKFFKYHPKKEIGLCKRYKSIITNEYMDVISTRYYQDLCAPCGKDFVKKK